MPSPSPPNGQAVKKRKLALENRAGRFTAMTDELRTCFERILPTTKSSKLLNAERLCYEYLRTKVLSLEIRAIFQIYNLRPFISLGDKWFFIS